MLSPSKLVRLSCAFALGIVLSVLLVPSARGEDAKADRPATQEALAGAEKLGWRLGMQAWTFHHLTLYATIDHEQALGLHYIELFPGQKLSKEKPGIGFDHTSPQQIRDEVKQKLKDAGIRAVSYGVVSPKGNTEADWRQVFDFAKDMGLDNIVCEPPMEAAEMLDKLANEYNINVALHDHPKPSRYWNPDTVLKFCEGRSKRLGSCADTGHWARSGLVPIECLKKLQGRIIEFHFKDLGELDAKAHDVPWGTGKCDVAGMLAEVQRQGVKNPLFSIEYEHTTPQLVSNLGECIQYFGKVSTELANKQQQARAAK
jgi:sugar phosphate isomerase/epimerase